MSAGHFQEFEDEYLEAMYGFYEQTPNRELELEFWRSHFQSPLHRLQRWFKDWLQRFYRLCPI